MRLKRNTTSGLQGSVFIAYLALALYSLHSLAQTDSSENEPLWYQIEVIIFENRNFRGDPSDPEFWPRNILLAYPNNSIRLITPEELKEIEAKEKELQAQQFPASQSDLNEVPEEKPFIDLGDEFYQLSRESRAVDSERDMRVLFHKVWRQPLASRETAQSIIVSGGNTYDEHYELEGSLTISVSRYLHLDADIWFSSFEANIGQEDNWWPSLPQPPNRNANLDMTDNFVDNKISEFGSTTPPWMQNQNGQTMRFGLNNSEKEDLSVGKQNYVIKQIVKLEQTRRMRSGELHYLDHPKLGILVRIDNYKKPGSDNEAELENAQR